MSRKLRTLDFVPIIAVLVSSLGHAQIVAPVRIGHGEINLPTVHGLPRDRILVVDMTVKKDGTVGDIDVVTGFYDEDYRNKAVQVLGGLRFEPATSNGVPVDFYGLRFVFTTRREFTLTTDPAFKNEFEKVTVLTQAGDFAAAETAVQDLINNRITTVFEYAFLNEALVPIYVKLNRPYEALRASRLATLHAGMMETEFIDGTHIKDNDANWPYFLPKDMLVKALRQRFAIAASLERIAEANVAFNELRTMQNLAENDPIVARARSLELQSRSPEPVMVQGKIEHGEWEFAPTRRVLSAKAVPGAVRSVDIKCRLHRERMAFDPDHDLLLPPPWGACTLTFAGNDGADIQVAEKVLTRTGLPN